MKRSIFLSIILFVSMHCAVAQYSKRVIFFTDKNGSSFSISNPTAYLSQKAINRRTKYSIAIDSTDIPVLQRYIDSIRLAGTVTILGRSKWLNAVIIQTIDAAAITKINNFPFVKKSDTVAFRRNINVNPVEDKFNKEQTAPISFIARTKAATADTFNYGSSSNQIKIHKGEFLHNIGARGQGMVMAFLDAGFTGFATNRFFDSARARNQFLGTWDFVSGNNNVNDDAHGLNCFSIVAGYLPGTYVGSCPEANYFLLRTEDAPTEQIIEEYNWVMGAEYADSAGVDVISSSLGYTSYDNPVYSHTYAEMNGNTTVVTQGADLAAKKGILVVNSAGNEGNSSWKFIAAPADGDSVLTIGAVNSSGIIASFSSFGPTSDGQIKPDVVSVGSGTALSNTSGNVSSGSGTSFSCPNMAGLATCLWQLFPEFNNWKIITTLRQSSDRFATPHPQYGYGLPNMKKAVGVLLCDISTMNASLNNFTATLNWSSKDVATMRYQIERKLPNESNYTILQTIQPIANPFALRSYNYNDVITNSPAGTVTYRIRQMIDTTGAGFDSYLIDSATVVLSAATSLNDINNNSKIIQLFPNPVQSSLTIKFNDQSVAEYTIHIYNQKGQLVSTQAFNKPSGIVIKSIAVTSLPNGNYILSLIKEGRLIVSREFIKQ